MRRVNNFIINHFNSPKLLFSSALIIFLAIPASAYPGWWENIKNSYGKEMLPVPQSTSEQTRKNMQINEQDLDTTIYISALPESAIVDFYKEKLPAYGWQITDFSKELSEAPDKMKPLMQRLNERLSKRPYFIKENKMLAINFMPAPDSDKTAYSVAIGLKEAPETREDVTLNPDLANLFAAYPAGEEIYSNKSTKGIDSAYATMDNIEDVGSFYLEKMRQEDWTLQAKSPVEEQAFNLPEQAKEALDGVQEIPKEAMKQLQGIDGFPEVIKNEGKVRPYIEMLKSAEGTKMYSATLVFTKGGELCMITVLQNDAIVKIDSQAKKTQIIINYLKNAEIRS